VCVCVVSVSEHVKWPVDVPKPACTEEEKQEVGVVYQEMPSLAAGRLPSPKVAQDMQYDAATGVLPGHLDLESGGPFFLACWLLAAGLLSIPRPRLHPMTYQV
jgi:hypothetical protein